MDSPLLPTLRGKSPRPSSPTRLADLSLADVSLADLSPDRSVRPAPAPLASSTLSSVSASAEPSSAAGPRRPRFADSPPRTSAVGTLDRAKAKPRFSLFAAGAGGSRAGATHEPEHEPVGEDEDEGEHEQEEEQEGDVTVQYEPSSAEREDRLRESLYELRSINDVFDGFLGALEATRGHNERLAERVSQTTRLLDQYVALLGQAEHTQRLLSNPRWTGASDDAAALEAEAAARHAAEQHALDEAERAAEAARAAQEDRQRRDEAVAAAAAARGRGGLPRGRGGVRGTVRGRGAGPGMTTGIPRTTARPGSAASNGAGAGSAGSGPGAGAGGRRTIAGGLGGQYAGVKSSGYGPPGRRS
ncbi:hypothetical protein Q5752_002599 [Cryptotrichosporon argae]